MPELRLWWPILLGLAQAVTDHRMTVRRTALTELECILAEYGGRFRLGVWQLIFIEVVLPLMARGGAADRHVQPYR